MSIITKYTVFINEEVNPPAPPAAPAAPLTIEQLRTHMQDLKNQMRKKVEDNFIYQRCGKSKDGQDIAEGDDFFTYAEYKGSINLGDIDKNMVFYIEIGESSRSGLSFTVKNAYSIDGKTPIQALNGKPIKSEELGYPDDKTFQLNPGFTLGKYLVQQKKSLNLLLPKSAGNTNQPKIDVKIGYVYGYETTDASNKKISTHYYITTAGIKTGNTFKYPDSWNIDIYDVSTTHIASFKKIKIQVAEIYESNITKGSEKSLNDYITAKLSTDNINLLVLFLTIAETSKDKDKIEIIKKIKDAIFKTIKNGEIINATDINDKNPIKITVSDIPNIKGNTKTTIKKGNTPPVDTDLSVVQLVDYKISNIYEEP